MHSASITADIEAGTTIIIDRYYYSGCVYSAAKDNPTLSLEWAHHPEVGLPDPDLVFFLDISPEDQAARGGFGTEKYEVKQMQDRVRELFATMREKNHEDFISIDAGQEADVVEKDIWERLENYNKNAKESELGVVKAW